MISLALQGGGAHGAFEWGVIDKLLEDGRVEIKAVTGASAGAMNGVVLAAGLIEGGVDGARERLEAFWRAVSGAGGHAAFGDTSVWSPVLSPRLAERPRPAGAWRRAGPVQLFALRIQSLRHSIPYATPCKARLTCKAVREHSPIRLYVSATKVRTSESRVFRTEELTADQVMASACLPHLFQAVMIEGEPYWDGGYLANPALWPLFYDPTPSDILIVNLNPFVRKETPKTPLEIVDRLNEITFNAPLVAELRAIAFVQKLIGEGLLTEKARGRYLQHADPRHRLRPLAAEPDQQESKFGSADWTFLSELEGPRAAARRANGWTRGWPTSG